MKKKSIVLILLLLLLTLFGCKSVQKQPDLKLAPTFSLKLLDGKTIRLQDLRGKVVVLNFWASWCPSCRQEAPALSNTYKAYKNKGVIFLGIGINDTEENLKAFVEEFKKTYPNGLDATRRIADAYGVTGVPETFIITKEGRIARKWIGPITESQLSAFIEEALELE